MRLNTIKTKCKYCGKEFIKSTKDKNQRLPLGVLSKKRITCSKKCSREYARERRNRQRKERSLRK